MSLFVWLSCVPVTGAAIALLQVRARLRRTAPVRPLVVAPVAPSAIREYPGVYLVCQFRGLYGNYPCQFHPYRVKLTPGGLLLQPCHLFKTSRSALTVTDDLLSARVRPFESESEARRLFSSGLYRAGGPVEESGRVVVCCRTSGGLLEFAVERREQHLLMAWIDIVKHRPTAQRGPLLP